MKPYYEKDGITIYHGDCREVLPGLQFDFVITSPPYNLGGEPWKHLGNWKSGDSAGGKNKWKSGGDACSGIKYSSHKDTMPWNEYVLWQHSILRDLWAAIPSNGAIFYNHKPRVLGTKLWTPLELIPPELILRQIIIWARPGGMNFNPAAFVPTHEWIMVIAKPGFRLKSKGVSGLGDVWKLSPDQNPHPAPFPLALPSKVLEAVAMGVIMDPFCGSGTTLVASKLAGRRAIGIEKSEEYCEMAANRLSQNVLDFRPLTSIGGSE